MEARQSHVGEQVTGIGENQSKNRGAANWAACATHIVGAVHWAAGAIHIAGRTH